MLEKVRVNNLRGWRKLVLYPLVVALKLFVSTLKFKPTKHMERFLETHNHPAIIVFWHQNLFLTWKLHSLLKSKLPTYGLISPSSDGAWLSAFFSMVGIGSIRGSSGRRGSLALSELQEKLKDGANVAITPDGPRGPAKKFKNGVAILALRSKVDVFLLAIRYKNFWTLNTWDKFRIPKPFSKIFIDCKRVPHAAIENLSPDEASLLLESKLR
ncbi:MAG: DUF374 domain-containing protein [Puniceicoccales bacterium]|jgi:lysophospholipid acyltransferase (LPLAT)-like uncharacterized protein|nr:DUF374 domain-containing protein [Puniceicoccales bacterium]